MATVDKNYLYSIGRVRELEKGLLNEANLVRVLDANDPLAVLRSIGFFKATEDHEHQNHVPEMFQREREYNQQQLHDLVADSALEDIFLLPYDIENVKLFLKAKLSANAEIKNIAIEEGLYRKSELLEAIYDELPTRVPPAIMGEVRLLSEDFQTQQKFSRVDYRLDRKLRELQIDIAQRAHNTFMIEYFRLMSDIQNISTIFRRKWHQIGREALTECLLDTGTLAPSFFERVYESGWESIITAFKPTSYNKLVAGVLIEVNQETFSPLLDASCSNYIIDFLKQTTYMSAGIEPVLAYYLAREHELKLVRLILAGKTFNVSQEQLHLRMRKLYG